MAEALDLIGAGLLNRGNTCFLNAVLQCLIHTVPLVEAIRSLDHKRRCSADNDEKFCALCALEDLMDLCQGSTGKTVLPDSFVENLSNISSLFKRFQQEDAHEFLHCLLDSLENSYKKHDGKRIMSSDETGIIQQTFGGRLSSVVKCCECGHCSETYDPVLDLSLEIEDVDSLYDALISFTKVEKVEDPETKFSCEGCNSRVTVEKQLKLDSMPTVVVLHLKRFKNDGGFFDKIDKHVSCPMELDLKYFLNSEVEAKFDLYALIVHSGWSSYSGHYYCFIRSSPGMWHKMDDDTVTRVSEDDVSEQEAYILFYIKRGSSPWYSSLMQCQKVDAVEILETKTSPSSVLDCLEEPFHSPSNGENNDSLIEASPSVESDVHAGESSSSPVIHPHNSSFVEVNEPCTSQSMANGSLNTADAEVTVEHLPSASLKERVMEVFSNETLEDDKENYYILPSSSKEAKPARRFKPCSRMHETVNRQLRQMGGSRRQALMAYLPGSLQNAIPENKAHKKRLHPESLGENDNQRRPTLKTR